MRFLKKTDEQEKIELNNLIQYDKLNTKFNKTNLLMYLVAISCVSIVISNLTAVKTFEIFGYFTLTCGVLTYPIDYILNDVISEIYGFKKARNIVLLGLSLNIFANIIYTITILLPAASFFTGQDAISFVLGNSARILLASWCSYTVGTIINSKVMVILRDKYYHHLFLRCMFSTLCGEGVDSVIFCLVGFLGVMPLDALVIMILSQIITKTGYEVICYPVTQSIIKRIKAIPDN